MLSYKCQVIVVSWTKTTTVSSPIASDVLSADKAQYLLVFSSLIAQIVYCGNPALPGADDPRPPPVRRLLRGQVVRGRYVPSSAAALEETSSGPGQSGRWGAPGRARWERGFKGQARGRRGGEKVEWKTDEVGALTTKCFAHRAERADAGSEIQAPSRTDPRPRRNSFFCLPRWGST